VRYAARGRTRETIPVCAGILGSQLRPRPRRYPAATLGGASWSGRRSSSGKLGTRCLILKCGGYCAVPLSFCEQFPALRLTAAPSVASGHDMALDGFLNHRAYRYRPARCCALPLLEPGVVVLVPVLVRGACVILSQGPFPFLVCTLRCISLFRVPSRREDFCSCPRLKRAVPVVARLGTPTGACGGRDLAHCSYLPPTPAAQPRSSADGIVKNGNGPGRGVIGHAEASSAVSAAIGRFRQFGVVMLVPVLRGRTAVTLGHGHLLAWPGRRCPLSLAAWPREHTTGCQPDRGRSELRRPL
jgi:hypothetical protein